MIREPNFLESRGKEDAPTRLTRRVRCSRVLTLVGLLCLAPLVASSATFIVNDDGDAGDINPGNGSCSTGGIIIVSVAPYQIAVECTLRAALEEANALAGDDTIEFSGLLTQVAGVVEISLNSMLPWITDTVTIDGYSHPDYDLPDPSARPEINVLGTSAGGGAAGFVFLEGSDDSVVRGMAISNFDSSAIIITPTFGPKGPESIVIEGNHIGINRGVFYQGNGLDGIHIYSSNYHRIGQVCGIFNGCQGKRNVIAANSRHGIHLDGTSGINFIAGNYIGVDTFGSSIFVPFGGSTSNGEWGVFVAPEANSNRIGNTGNIFDFPNGGNTPVGGGNLISGNGSGGVRIESDLNYVLANNIGTNAAGTSALANDGHGVHILGDDNTIGSVGVGRNLISGNAGHGLLNDAGTGFTPLRTEITGNLIGVTALGNGVLGNGQSGLYFWGSDHEVADNVIGGNAMNGITDQGYSGRYVRNMIGTNELGDNVGNSGSGIIVYSGPVQIGEANNGNTIGLNEDGIRGAGSAFNTTIEGNYVGVNESGFAIGNYNHGISMDSSNYAIGGLSGASTGTANVIGRNGGHGIRAAGFDPQIKGNFVGTDGLGRVLSNTQAGIHVDASFGLNSAIGGAVGDSTATVIRAANTVANNSEGIEVAPASSEMPIRGNSLWANGGIGVDLGLDGETDNDVADVDTGANKLQNTPIFDAGNTYWNSVTGNLEIRYGLDASGPPDVAYPIEVDFYIHDPWLNPGDQARVYVGTDSYTAIEAGNFKTATISPPSGAMEPNVHGFVFEGLRAMATDADGNTSELTMQTVPVPEPGMPALLMAGLMGCSVLGRLREARGAAA